MKKVINILLQSDMFSSKIEFQIDKTSKITRHLSAVWCQFSTLFFVFIMGFKEWSKYFNISKIKI